ncbi:MAG: aminotransferase class I/II-fold pyridoxal phosphate-dependent enzyme [Desulfobacterales bacterium]|nr:aminotransferase class I/II-fold pyridoxal phosphate-dependent enzyme [Desulfobacterales bacterium]
MNSPAMDPYGFPIDPTVGFARGPIIKGSLEEAKRRLHALELIRRRRDTHGADAFYNITGLHRGYPLDRDKLNHAEEWVGPAYFWDEMEVMARAHFGGTSDHDVLVFNRCSAGIISACLAIVRPGTKVISLVPGKRSHPSIGRGVRLAGGELVQVNEYREVAEVLDSEIVSFMVITGVSSELEVIDVDTMTDSIALAKKVGVPVMLDDAYGTRLRPIIYNGPGTMETGVNLGVTACDKAGMSGPRAGLMVGEKQFMEQVNTKAAELGLEARAPLAAGIWASLKEFTPRALEDEVAFGVKVYERLSGIYGKDKVIKSGIGASLTAESAYELVKEIRGTNDNLPISPGEVSAAIGMYWLKEYGMISVNALGQPGASIWLRFKAEPNVIEKMGGLDVLVNAIDNGLRYVAENGQSIDTMKALILGE